MGIQDQGQVDPDLPLPNTHADLGADLVVDLTVNLDGVVRQLLQVCALPTDEPIMIPPSEPLIDATYYRIIALPPHQHHVRVPVQVVGERERRALGDH